MSRNFLLLFLCGLVCCRHSVEIIANQSLNTREYSSLSGQPQKQSIVKTGVFGRYTVGPKKLPALFNYDSAKGIGYTCLADSLQFPDGALIEVSGLIDSLPLCYGAANAVVRWPVLRISSSRMLKDLQPLRGTVNEIYQDKFHSISQAIFIAESRLNLSKQPLWRMAWDGENDHLIACCRSSDLMYEAEIDILIDLANEHKITIFAMQKFKGE
jgi:hypothetical protein